ncbi:ankyrin, partial [Neocallimastix californiae]
MNSRSSHKKWIQREINRVNEKNETALMYACLRGNYDIVKCLVDHQADVRIKSKYNGTALNYAVQGSNDKIVEFLLLEAGAKIDEKDYQGYTGLLWACENENHEMIRFLIGKGANIHICNDYGYNAL